MSQYKQMVFVSIPVADLSKSITFYEAIGFKRNPQFSDPSGACMVLSETFYLMLITKNKWKEFTTREIPNAKKSAQFALIVSAESKAAVDKTIESGAKAGGIADPNPVEDYGSMYGRSLEDPDGHIFETKWMDSVAIFEGKN